MQEQSAQARADPDQILLMGDSAQVSLLPTLTRCWTKIGHQRVIPTPGVRAEKRWDWGAVDLLTGRSVHLVHTKRNNVGFRRLLAAISRAYELPSHPERQVILWVDNDQAHEAKPVRALLDKHSQLQIEHCATYAPEYNAQEYLWQHLRRKVTHNHYFETIAALLGAVVSFHDDLEAHPEAVLQLLGIWTKLITT